MSIAPVSGSGLDAVAAGVRGELKAAVLRRALDDAGILNENLARGFDAAGEVARSLTEAGLAAAEAEMVGTLVDVLA